MSGMLEKEEKPELFYDSSGSNWIDVEYDNFLQWIYKVKNIYGLSDIHFISENKIYVRSYGVWVPVTPVGLSVNSIKDFINKITNDNSSSAQLVGGIYIDFQYTYRVDRYSGMKFRCNATGCIDKKGNRDGVSLVLRFIPDEPPSLEALGVEKEIIDACTPQNGLVLTTGVMGSGKSTLNGAIFKKIIQKGGRYVGTYEDPIEFDLMNINPDTPVTQSEMKRHLKDFYEVCRNASRRAIDVMLVGESRDRETLHGMLTAAEMGMAVYSTVHTRTVSEIFSRIIAEFPSDDWNMINSLLIRSIRLGIQQRLLPTIDGKRVAIREYMIFNEDHRKELLKLDVQQVAQRVKEMVISDGVTLQKAAQRRYDEGKISKEILKTILDEDR